MSAPPMTPAMVRAIETSAFHLFISKYYALAATAMLVYDTFLTFDREVDAIWRSKWTAVKALFFFNRYANIGAYVTSIVAINSTWPRDMYVETRHITNTRSLNHLLHSCLRYVIFPGIFNLIQQVVIGSILMLYTYALFNRSKTVFGITFTVFLVQIVVIGWSLGAITAVPLPRGFVGCIYAGKTGTGIRVQTSWIMQLVFISVAFGLMIWKAVTLKKCQVRAPLVTIMTKDGLKYFGVIFTANFVNVMNFSLVKTTSLRSIHATFSALITVIMINRLILSVREEASRPTWRSTSGSEIPNSSLIHSTLHAVEPQDIFKTSGRRHYDTTYLEEYEIPERRFGL